MNKEALLRLADKLEGKGPYEKDGPLPVEKFDLANWFGEGTESLEPTSCGFAACACGWAATDPWFKERGLTATVYSDGGPAYIEWEKVQSVFGLCAFDAGYLFQLSEYQNDHDPLEMDEYGEYGDPVYRQVPPSEVAARIRYFVARER